jgi:HKD family nuclease
MNFFPKFLDLNKALERKTKKKPIKIFGDPNEDVTELVFFKKIVFMSIEKI